MNKCSTRGCTEEGSTTWPLIPGEPSLCGHHLDHPTPQFADLVAAANEPPDDFDIPEWDEPPVLLPRYLTAAKDTWVTKDGRAIRIPQLEDSHLHNIHRMLKRIASNMDEVDEETGNPVGNDMPSDIKELFDRKLSTIEAEIQQRGGQP